MKIELIAYTKLDTEILKYTNPLSLLDMELDEESSMVEDLIEFAGRACYQSFNKPNEKTRANKDYIENIIAQGHESVLEHASASFYVEGVSRNLLLELERHRHLSFSVLSQRFVNSSDTPIVIPPALQDDESPVAKAWAKAQMATQEAYDTTYEFLKNEKKLGRKQAREAARAILPGGLETKFVVTGNMRAWRDVLKKRYSVHADAEICLFAASILSELENLAPAVFADFPYTPFDD